MKQMCDDDDDDNHAAPPRGGTSAAAGDIVNSSERSDYDDQLSTTLLSLSSSPRSVMEPSPMILSGRHHDDDEEEVAVVCTNTNSCRNGVGLDHHTTMSTTSIISSVLEKSTLSSNPSSYCFCCRDVERNNHDQYNDFVAPSFPYNHHADGPHNDAVTMIQAVLDIIEEACDLLDEEDYSWY